MLIDVRGHQSLVTAYLSSGCTTYLPQKGGRAILNCQMHWNYLNLLPNSRRALLPVRTIACR